MGRVRSAADASANWKAAMSNGMTATKYKQGVNAVQTAPTALAAQPDALQRYQQGTQQAVASGKMANRLNAVSLQSWQQAAAGRGAANLAQAAAKGGAKVDAAMQRLAPSWSAMSQAAAAVPRGAKGDLGVAMAKMQAALNAQKQALGNS